MNCGFVRPKRHRVRLVNEADSVGKPTTMRSFTTLAQTSVLSFVWLLALSGGVFGQGPALTKIEVSPPDINLNTTRDRQSFIVQATYADGITRDVTAEAKVAFTNPALVRLEKNVTYPLADGAT